ncbi:EthD domain-containing protein [Phenylobacterium sp. LjRoot225]|uniref:EthD domain-containing protein n=1 Tax=Phenylobacterium sp. LjRoot225 TaxID=3342285 RepID=UPI003ECEDE48
MDFKLIYLAKRNPAVSPEDWPRAWRAHAVFASQFPVLGARISSLFYCSRQFAPTLDGVCFDPPGASRDYDGVAVVSSPSAESLGGDMTPDDRARIYEDERRVFSAQTPDFSFRCRETLVHGGAPGPSPTLAAVFRFLARKAGASPEAFEARWNGGHAEIAARAADATGKVTRYVHDLVIEEPPAGYPFDGVAETWFASPDDAVRSFVDDAFAPVAQDLAEFCDLDRSVTVLTSVIHRWPRA